MNDKTNVSPPASDTIALVMNAEIRQLILDLAVSQPCTNHGLLLRKRARKLIEMYGSLECP